MNSSVGVIQKCIKINIRDDWNWFSGKTIDFAIYLYQQGPEDMLT